jgi:hypothetical protein
LHTLLSLLRVSVRKLFFLICQAWCVSLAFLHNLR